MHSEACVRLKSITLVIQWVELHRLERDAALIASVGYTLGGYSPEVKIRSR